MKKNLITDVIQGMLPYLNNAQTERLQEVLQHTLFDYEVTKTERDKELSEQNLVESFLSAKRIEGCSEKTLKYYNATIQSMLDGIGKGIKYIVTDDIRCYLTEYQAKKKSSKVTIDNIRRILSSFFSWLEDEDYILKSPVRRIHKVKTGTNIKETYSDEALELMRDNCKELRDLAMIDMLASTGMRVGEMVLLNREDIDFNEREFPHFLSWYAWTIRKPFSAVLVLQYALCRFRVCKAAWHKGFCPSICPCWRAFSASFCRGNRDTL